MTPGKLKLKLNSTDSHGNGEASLPCSRPDNGFNDSLALSHSEKAVQECLQQTPIQHTDDHLMEFSEALRTVAKALRQAAEGKASAQAEAAEWKRRFELQMAQNQQLEHKGKTPGEYNGDINAQQMENSTSQPMLRNEANEQSESCCINGLCSHEFLHDGETDSRGKAVQNKMMRKASFKLSWRCKGDESDQHKHDIVSFERGNITAAGRSSKQIHLKWESSPQTVLVMTKPNSTSVQIQCAEMIRC